MRRHPDWLKVKIGGGKNFVKMKSLLRNAKLHTICEEAKCPNIAECFGNRTAVFLILGDICTRNCKYCNVKHGAPDQINSNEPKEVAESVKELGLGYVVITSVTRDDLDDGGGSFFHKTIKEVKKINKNCKLEVLIPDFNGNFGSLKNVVNAKPDVINHNIEVVQDLFPEIRPEGNYKISIQLLKNIKDINKNIKSKSGFMIGLGENKDQILKTMIDLRNANVDFLTIGQYLQPTKNHAEIKKYYTPKEFEELKNIAIDLGFKHVESGPLVRSSYHAERVFC
ncbi:lipoyl synthase [Thermoplasmatales archaeon SG8-52-1]|nr:MAG: lipoyl synthase [Thermoplasmatales archaeon SG8-52-1]